jgi:glycerol transport system permease protein
MKPVNQKAWLLILPVLLCVAFSAILPLMTVVNYSVQDIISPERRVFCRHRVVCRGHARPRLA